MRDKWLPAALVVALIGAMFYALHADFEVISAQNQSAEQPNEKRASADNQSTNGKGFFDVSLVDIANLILAGSTVGLWLATRRLWRSSDTHASHADRAINVTQDAAQRELRAYVALSGFSANLIQGPNRDIRIWQITPEWHNAGQTPTRNGRNSCNWGFFSRGDSPEQTHFQDVYSNDEASLLNIGSRIKIDGAKLDVEIDWIWATFSLLGRIYIWGWVEYDDVFAPVTPRRRTEYCVYLEWSGRPDIPNPAHIHFRHYRTFNATDEDCYHQPLRQPIA